MNLRLKKIAATLLLGWMGFIMAAYPVAAMIPAPTAPAAKSCCTGGKCCKMACCAAPKHRSAPAAPVSAPASSQSELQVVAASIISLLTLPTPGANEFTPRFASSFSLTAIPLFQRDCCYLI